MAVFRSVLKIKLNGTAELHVVKEDRNPYVLLSVVPTREGAVRKRTTIRVSNRDAASMAKFMLGVSDEAAVVERIERETTQPFPPRAASESKLLELDGKFDVDGDGEDDDGDTQP